MPVTSIRIQRLRLGLLCAVLMPAMAACGQSAEPETAPETGQENSSPTEQETASSSDGVEAHAQNELTPVFKEGTDFVMGYTGTPMLPDGKWHVHDPDRPRPAVVEPAGGIYTAPPSDAKVLFDGSDMSQWELANEGAPEWDFENGVMSVPSHDWSAGGADLLSREAFGDIQLHIEWRAPEDASSGSQGRSNSGIFLMKRYEVQVLDSYQNETYADGQASAIYGWKPPLSNATLPPGEWQSYDIIFEAPHFDEEGELESPAYVTVFHNGILTLYREKFLGTSTHQTILPYEAHAAEAPILLQDHGNPVAFRNIWVRELDLERD